MREARVHAAEQDELGRIDYFLDHLARAVERGEVPFASYETLSPRYLARREELVAILTGSRRVVPGPAMQSAAVGASGVPAATPQWAAGAGDRASAAVSPQAASRRVTKVREPVRWTTILLFLGAFLVIVASGIFALAVWNSTGPAFKLGFLGVLTAAFYAAGYYARTKLDLRAGGAALTVVASAMLLFDCWIVIDGWNLTGPMPWAIALFACSAVYWFTEIKLGDRFYGIAGAAGQVGWWWLMTAGLHVEVPVRLAGMALIALVWQLVAERARDDAAFSSLAEVLLWAAPLTGVAVSVGVAFDAISVGTSSLVSAACAALVAISTAVIVLRSELLPAQPRRWIAGALQLPLFVLLMQPGPSTWIGVAGLFAVTAIYTIIALKRFGTPFAIAALATETLAVNALLSMVDSSDTVRVGALAALAVTWTLASRLAERLAEDPALDADARSAAPGAALTTFSATAARETSNVLQGGGFGLLVLMSALAPTVGAGVPLLGVVVPPEDVVLAAWILVTWAASCLIRRAPAAAFSTALWSLYAGAALMAWALPDMTSAYYALGLLAVTACWLAAHGAVERYYGTPRGWFGWAMRAGSLLILVGGLLAETLLPDRSLGAMAFLALAAALIFALDAAIAGPRVSAAFAAAIAVLAAGLGGLNVRELSGDAVLAATSSGAVLAAAGVALRSRWTPRAQWLSVAGAAGATLAAVMGAEGWTLAGALVLVAVAWAAAGVTTRWQYLALPTGLALFAATVAGVSAIDPAPWVAIGVLAAAGLALGVPSALPETGREGGHARVGQAFALAGLIGLAYLISQGVSAQALGWPIYDWPGWTDFGVHGRAVTFVVAGAYIVAQSALWRLEPALYAGYALLLVAVSVELESWDSATMQMYTSAVAIYLAAMGVLYVRREADRRIPVALDVATVVVGVGLPALYALAAPMGPTGFDDLVWAVLLALVGITAGIALKVRAYLFGAAAALVLVVGWRSFAYLASVWWLVLGLVGTAMLVIALTWERQRQALTATQRRLRDGFEHWR